MKALVDNDIILKGACYGLLSELVEVIPASIGTVGVLGAARYVVKAALKHMNLVGDATIAQTRLTNFFRNTQVIEPTTEEEQFAAELEYQAQRASLSLDTGESQLSAVLISRRIPLMATGDKRAITALERLLDVNGRVAYLANRLLCLEQLLLRLLQSQGEEILRSTICTEPDVDLAISNSFSCSNPSVPQGDCETGLRSYVRHLRETAPRILAAD